MKELKLYQCEICKSRYESAEDAEACEANHHTIAGCRAKKYRSKIEYPGGYPETVTVIFDNDEELVYALQ